LEYGSVVWSPWKKKYVNNIEQVQRRFTKLIYGMMGLNYEQRLKELNLQTSIQKKEPVNNKSFSITEHISIALPKEL